MDTALDIERYRVKHHQKIKLSRFSTRCDQENMNKLEVKKVLMPKVLTAMRDLQERLYAEKKYGLIFAAQSERSQSGLFQDAEFSGTES